MSHILLLKLPKVKGKELIFGQKMGHLGKTKGNL